MSDEQIIKMLELRAEGKTEAEMAEALGISASELRQLKDRHQVAVGKAVREQAERMSEEDKDNQEIAAELGITENQVRRLLQPPEARSLPPGFDVSVQKVKPEITEDQIIWFPGIYHGREDIYAEPAHGFDRDELVVLVQARAQEDGEWSIENNRVGGRLELMRKMMGWVSDPKNIIQCYEANPNETVDWICRDLANASKRIGGSRG